MKIEKIKYFDGLGLVRAGINQRQIETQNALKTALELLKKQSEGKLKDYVYKSE